MHVCSAQQKSETKTSQTTKNVGNQVSFRLSVKRALVKHIGWVHYHLTVVELVIDLMLLYCR